MSGAPSGFRFMERISRPAPLGLVFWDFATGTPVADGLSVSVAPRGRPGGPRPLISNRNGVWLAPDLPGRSAYELATGDWAALRRTYRVELFDTLGRFLPLAFDAELPSRGLYHWPGWDTLPTEPVTPLGADLSPPRISPRRIPLFSAPGRPTPPALAEVRCQLVDSSTGRAAAWALLSVAHAGLTRGIGLADREGRVALLFGYPERPRPSLATSPPAITDYRWELEAKAFFDPAQGAPPAMPDLERTMAQLDHPRDLLASTLSPPELLPSQLLTYGRPMVLRTSRTAEGSSSSLFLGPD